MKRRIWLCEFEWTKGSVRQIVYKTQCLVCIWGTNRYIVWPLQQLSLLHAPDFFKKRMQPDVILRVTKKNGKVLGSI